MVRDGYWARGPAHLSVWRGQQVQVIWSQPKEKGGFWVYGYTLAEPSVRGYFPASCLEPPTEEDKEGPDQGAQTAPAAVKYKAPPFPRKSPPPVMPTPEEEQPRSSVGLPWDVAPAKSPPPKGPRPSGPQPRPASPKDPPPALIRWKAQPIGGPQPPAVPQQPGRVTGGPPAAMAGTGPASPPPPSAPPPPAPAPPSNPPVLATGPGQDDEVISVPEFEIVESDDEEPEVPKSAPWTLRPGEDWSKGPRHPGQEAGGAQPQSGGSSSSWDPTTRGPRPPDPAPPFPPAAGTPIFEALEDQARKAKGPAGRREGIRGRTPRPGSSERQCRCCWSWTEGRFREGNGEPCKHQGEINYGELERCRGCRARICRWCATPGTTAPPGADQRRGPLGSYGYCCACNHEWERPQPEKDDAEYC